MDVIFNASLELYNFLFWLNVFFVNTGNGSKPYVNHGI